MQGKITISIIFLILFLSCKKDPPIKETEDKRSRFERFITHQLMSSGMTGNYDGSIVYGARGEKRADTSNTVVKETYYDVFAQFLHSTQPELLTAGDLQVGAITLAPNATFGNSYQLPSSMIQDAIHNGQFGTSLTFSISGSADFPASSTTIYVPKEIYIDTVSCQCINSFPVVKLSSSPYRINWNADPNNNEGVVVLIRYNAQLSQHRDPSFAGSPFFNPPIFTTDNGYYDISANDLINIPAGAVFDLIIGRGNQEDMLSGSKKISVEAVSRSSRSFLLEM
jgi:hypothetical protein